MSWGSVNPKFQHQLFQLSKSKSKFQGSGSISHLELFWSCFSDKSQSNDFVPTALSIAAYTVEQLPGMSASPKAKPLKLKG